MTQAGVTTPRWWETRWYALAVILASAVPLLWPAMPPLEDLPEHIGRYHIAAAIATSPDLQRHWQFEWALVGNLGVDLVVQLLSPWLSAEAAAKLVVLLIPPLWVSALILLSRRAGHRLSPAAPFAFPLVYGYAFQLGFVNFLLSAGLALHAVLLWDAMDRRPLLRTPLFVPIAFALWVGHSFGWGMFGLLAFASSYVRTRAGGRSRPFAAMVAAAWCAPLAWPVALMVGGAPGSIPFWDWKAKISWFPGLLRERWKWYDAACAFILYALVWTGLRDRRFAFDPLTGTAALLCFGAFLVLPRLMFNGAYVDMRMLAPALALALVALRVRPGHRRLEARLAMAGTAFLAVRTATTTVAFLLFAGPQSEALKAIDHLPRGTAVLVLVNQPCASQWHDDRLGHIAGIAVARRDVFENGQWAIADQQLLRPRHPSAEPYRADPSQLVYPLACEYTTTDFRRAIQSFDRGTFRYVWTVNFPARPALARDVRLIWANRVSSLYAVN